MTTTEQETRTETTDDARLAEIRALLDASAKTLTLNPDAPLLVAYVSDVAYLLARVEADAAAIVALLGHAAACPECGAWRGFHIGACTRAPWNRGAAAMRAGATRPEAPGA